MIVKLNHLQGKMAAASAQEVVAALYALLAEGSIDQSLFARLQIELDWIQYKLNFRDTVVATQAADANGKPTSLMSVHVNTRQVAPDQLKPSLLRSLARVRMNGKERDADRVPLEEFQSMRTSLIWEFNKLYWSRVNDWERATGKGFEEALPKGGTVADNLQAIEASVREFRDLLRELEAKNQLPPEIFPNQATNFY